MFASLSADSLIVSVNPTAARYLLLPSPNPHPSLPIFWGLNGIQCFCFCFFGVCVCVFLAVPCSMHDLSSPTRDRTRAPCGGSMESSPLDHQGSPWNTVLTVPLKHLQFRRGRFYPWVGKIPWRRKWQPTLVFLLGKSHGWRSLAGYSPWGHKESDTTGQLTLHFTEPSEGKCGKARDRTEGKATTTTAAKGPWELG